VTNFEWSDALKLNDAEVDGQHMQMFLLAKRVVDSLSEKGIGKVDVGLEQLQALIDFTEEHFAFEEGLMRSTDYPGAAWHAKYHASLLTELRTFFRKVQGGEIANAVGLVKFVWNWLHQHIDTVDRELVVWLSDRVSHGSG
jgi:hemerythrin